MSQVDYIESNFIILCHVRDIEMANIKSAVYVCIIKTHFLNLISHSKERERECWNLFFSIIHTFSACTFEILISASCLDRSRETGGKIFWKFAQSPPHFCFVCLVFVDLYTQSKRRGEREENTFNVITFIKLNVYTCHRRVRDAIGFEALWEKEGVVGQTPKQHGLSFFFFFLLFFFIFLTSFLCFFPEYGFNSRLATFTC